MIFLGGKKSEAFHFQRCYPRKSILTRIGNPPRATSKIAKSRAHELSITAFDTAPAITPATLYPGIILHIQQGIPGCFYRRGTSTRGLTPVCLELRLRSQRSFIADLSSGFTKRWHSLLPPSWRYGVRQEPRPGSLSDSSLGHTTAGAGRESDPDKSVPFTRTVTKGNGRVK